MSLSTYALHHITAFRNPNGSEYVWTSFLLRSRANCLKVGIAEVGYIAMIPIAVIETAFSAIARIFSNLPCLNQFKESSVSWFRNSSLGLFWSVGNVFLNVIVNDLLIYPVNVHKCILSGAILRAPELHPTQAELMLI